ncbi:hypothetical protein [Nannocystis exedens]|uniref:hypothetical protein n=1 Tax=Nannocystis exedens TaxID=54 RepID=UPI000BBA07F1|nr:hypothetical protein [Nannocystis exedens]
MIRNTPSGLLIALLVVFNFFTYAACKSTGQDERLVLEARKMQDEARRLQAAELAAAQECAARDEEREAEMRRLMATLADLKQELAARGRSR